MLQCGNRFYPHKHAGATTHVSQPRRIKHMTKVDEARARTLVWTAIFDYSHTYATYSTLYAIVRFQRPYQKTVVHYFPDACAPTSIDCDTRV